MYEGEERCIKVFGRETCKRRWEDNIKMGRKEIGWDWFHAGQDRDNYRSFVSMAV
jgi:hypothetical protein